MSFGLTGFCDGCEEEVPTVVLQPSEREVCNFCGRTVSL